VVLVGWLVNFFGLVGYLFIGDSLSVENETNGNEVMQSEQVSTIKLLTQNFLLRPARVSGQMRHSSSCHDLQRKLQFAFDYNDARIVSAYQFCFY